MSLWEDYYRHISPERGGSTGSSFFYHQPNVHTNKAPSNQIWDAIELRSETELTPEIGRAVLGKIQCMMLSRKLHNLITLVQHYRAAKEFRWKSVCLLKPSSSPFSLHTSCHSCSSSWHSCLLSSKPPFIANRPSHVGLHWVCHY